MRMIAVACSISGLVACGSPDLPRISAPSRSLSADDLAVMKAVLDDVRRSYLQRNSTASRDHASRPLPPLSVLMFTASLALCEKPRIAPEVAFGRLSGCIDDRWLDYLHGVTEAPDRSTMRMFKDRNSRSLTIGGDLGDHVVFIPAWAERIDRLSEFGLRYVPATFVALSAPVYPGRGTAVIAYSQRSAGRGFTLLRGSGANWTVARTSGIIE